MIVIFPFYRFANDGVSFSLNTDDPVVTGTTLSDEFVVAETKVGIARERLIQTVSGIVCACSCTIASTSLWRSNFSVKLLYCIILLEQVVHTRDICLLNYFPSVT